MATNGIEHFSAAKYGLSGKRIGLVTAPAAVTASLQADIDRIHENFCLAQLFAPEHGVRGSLQAGQLVDDGTDEKTGVPVCSLYGGDAQERNRKIEALDAVVFDVQDVGCRYYTFLDALKTMMKACAEQGKRFIVLDRVNPIGGAVEGNLLDMNFSSAVGTASIPQRYGMTVGELARMLCDTEHIGCDLTVVPVQGWKRGMYYDQTGLPWVNPSPNIPGLDAAVLYAGTCLFEGTNLSEGRGTTKPFEMIGAPWLDAETLAGRMNEKNLPGVRFRPVYFEPCFSKHKGSVCRGVQVHITDKQAVKPLLTGLHLLRETVEMSGDNLRWLPPNKEKGDYFIDLLAGTDTLRKTMDIEAYYARCESDSAEFAQQAKAYLLYD